MDYAELVKTIADVLKDLDSERPTHKAFQPGIGPFGEPQLVREMARRLAERGMDARTKRTPDLEVTQRWALEIKIVRPFGDNGQEAENWSVNLLHPYSGNVSLLSDALKLIALDRYPQKGVLMVGYEHCPAKISLDPLICSFEAIAEHVMQLPLGMRVEERRYGLVHPEHQVLRCVGWEVK